ncbi:MAG TPA: HD domain-containing protein [Candidatus Sulfotelmatobacter sp.]|nr:HD domain-containing protein [Candidatus Sulfotelmatobacter sp.]
MSLCGLAAATPRPNAHSNAFVHSRLTVDEAPLPKNVAGIRLVDSHVARKAALLARECSPPYLFNHAVRTFLFASITGRSLKQNFDEELLFLACIFHDMGLTDRFQGDLPFEIKGAEAAKQFLTSHSYAEPGIQTIWDGIAMHASAKRRLESEAGKCLHDLVNLTLADLRRISPEHIGSRPLRYVSGFRPKNFCDLVVQALYSD